MNLPDYEIVNVTDLKEHPKNYNDHPEDQVKHLAASLEQHGQYRNIVVANDNTILAGHGVVLAAKSLEWDQISVTRVDVDPDHPKALKILAADNTLSNFSMVDDRDLSELLKEIRDVDEFGLYGTGFDDMMLANLVLVTRPASEIKNHDHAAEWLGMPDYEPKPDDMKYTIIFRSNDDRERFANQTGLKIGRADKAHWSTWWPEKKQLDNISLKYE